MNAMTACFTLTQYALAAVLLAAGTSPALAQNAGVVVTHSYQAPVIDFGEVTALECGGDANQWRTFTAELQIDAISMLAFGNTAIPVSQEMTATAGGEAFAIREGLDAMSFNEQYPLTAVFAPQKAGTYVTKFRFVPHNFLIATKLVVDWVGAQAFGEDLDDEMGRKENELKRKLTQKEKTEAMKTVIDRYLKHYFYDQIPTSYRENLAYLTLKGTASCPQPKTENSTDNSGNGDGGDDNEDGELVFYGSGDRPTYIEDTIESPLAVGDINHDGTNDIVSVDAQTNTVNILVGDDAGTLTVGQRLTGTLNAKSVSLEDVNGDMNADLVVHERGSANGLVYLGNGDGSFTETPDVTVQQGQLQATGDLNGDRIPDQVVLDERPNQVTIYLGDGAGGRYRNQDLDTGYSPNGVVITDIDGDGVVDLLVNNDSDISVYHGNGDGTFQTEQVYFVDGTE